MRIEIGKTKFSVFILTVIAFVFYCFFESGDLTGEKFPIYALSLLGWIEWFFFISSWKQVTGKFFTPYTIFISFAILFNYGQCLMWALGFHIPKEIGNYPSFGVHVSYESIEKTQLLTLMGMLALHCGAVLSYKTKQCEDGKVEATNYSYRDCLNASLLTVTKITLVISSLCNFYECVQNVIITRYYGYGANLYNDSVSSGQNNLVVLISWLFMPSIIGVLLSSGYSKRWKKVCYSLFGLNAILELMAGDRGFIYWILLLVWMHHQYYERIDYKKMCLLVVAGAVVVSICAGLSATRGNGVSIAAIIEAITSDENPIVAAFFELGNSMKPAIIIVEKETKYPFGNTYLLALLGMVTERLIKPFIPGYEGVGSWFSQTYLRLSYGADFSIIAEALINFGLYGSMIALFIIGCLIPKFVEINTNKDDTVTAFFKLSFCSSILVVVRGTMLNGLKHVFFSTVLLYAIVYITANIIYNKSKE